MHEGPFTVFAEEAHEDSADLLFMPEATAADWAIVFSHAEVRHIGAGLALLQAGEDDRALYLLTEGTVGVRLPRDEGTFKTIDAPSVLGELAFYETVTGYRVTPIVAWVEPPFALLPDPSEVADVFEVPFAFLMDPANHERRHRDQPPGPPRWYWAITWPEKGQDRLIWGVTAGMVRGLYERLEAAHAERA